METHVIKATLRKKGYIELKDLPFKEGTTVEISIVEKKRKKSIQKLIDNDHIWDSKDIKAVKKGRDIINKWPIS